MMELKQLTKHFHASEFVDGFTCPNFARPSLHLVEQLQDYRDFLNKSHQAMFNYLPAKHTNPHLEWAVRIQPNGGTRLWATQSYIYRTAKNTKWKQTFHFPRTNWDPKHPQRGDYDEDGYSLAADITVHLVDQKTNQVVTTMPPSLILRTLQLSEVTMNKGGILVYSQKGFVHVDDRGIYGFKPYTKILP